MTHATSMKTPVFAHPIFVTAAKRKTARKTNTYGRRINVPRSRRGMSSTSTRGHGLNSW
jgi:hypothetical protein